MVVQFLLDKKKFINEEFDILLMNDTNQIYSKWLHTQMFENQPQNQKKKFY